MKRTGGLWERVVSWENLWLAACKARRGKRSREVVQRFEFAREPELLRLQRELIDGHYEPGPFHTHWISRPKPRLISAAPYRDRVVHHAVMNLLEPVFERSFHPHSYACRKGKGTHAAVNHLQGLLRRHRNFIFCDVRKFFPSIDHAVLKRTYRRIVKDQRVLELLDRIVDHSNEQEAVCEWFPGDGLFTPLDRRRGLPIGNLTSQWLANLYLTGLDHFLTSGLGVGGFVRYCDDFVLLDDDRGRLRAAGAAAAELLLGARLKLHEERAFPRAARGGLTFLGYRVWPTHRFPSRANIRRFRRRVRWLKKMYSDRLLNMESISQRLMGWLGHARQADSAGLVRRLSRSWVFRRW